MTSPAPAYPTVETPSSLADASDRLDALGPDGAALAGGTWLMRGAPPAVLVALHRIVQLRGVGPTRWGALATHTDLASAPLPPALQALRTAAATSAFPQIRNVATLGGNLCARGFAEADLVTALLAVEAEIEVAAGASRSTRSVADVLRDGPGGLVVAVTAPAPADRRSGYARLTVRGAGEYPVAAAAVSADLDRDGVATAVRVALGVVENVARRSAAAEQVLTGTRLDEASSRTAGQAAAATLDPRDDLLAPGWYRRAVLPAVLAMATADCLAAGGAR